MLETFAGFVGLLCMGLAAGIALCVLLMERVGAGTARFYTELMQFLNRALTVPAPALGALGLLAIVVHAVLVFLQRGAGVVFWIDVGAAILGAAAGALTTYARGDHVHPTDTSRYAASNPAGYITASQAIAGLPIASTTVFGVVKVDGTTIIATGGVISSTGGAGVYLPLTGGTLTGTLTIPQGTQTTPQLLFAGAATNTGIFYLAGIAFTVAGGAKFQIASTANVSYVLFRTADGSVSAPGYSFVQETGSGLFRKTTGVVSMAMLGVEAMNWTATGNTTNALGPLMLAADPTVALQAVTKQYVDARVGGLTDAPSDGKAYSRRNAVWTSNPFYDAKGNLGISVVPPTAQGTPVAGLGGWTFAWGMTANHLVGNGYFDGTSWRYLSDGTVWMQQQSSASMFWQYAPSGLKDAIAPLATKMQLDSAGNLTGLTSITAAYGAFQANSYPNLMFYCPVNGADAKRVQMFEGTLGDFGIQWVNDANNVGTTFFAAARNGYGNSTVSITSPSIYMNGELLGSGNIFANGAVFPAASGTANGFALYLDGSGYRQIRFTTDNWRLAWQTDGALVYSHPTLGGLFSVDSAGGGWFKGNVIASSRMLCSDMMNHSGTFYVASNYAYYLQRSGDTNWYFVENGTINFTVSANGDTNSRGVSQAAHQFSRGNVYCQNSWERYFGGGASGVVLQFQTSYYWDFNWSTGSVAWVNPNGWVIFMDTAMNTTFSGGVFVRGSALVLQVGCTGIRYESGSWSTNNTFLFGWTTFVSGLAHISVDNGGAIYALANASDERLKLDIQPSTFDALATVNRIPLVEFDWLDMDGNDTWGLKQARTKGIRSKLNAKARIGVVAQQLNEVFPEGVHRGDDFDDHLGRVWGLDQNVMIALLLGAVQQLTGRITELEARA